MHLSPTTLVAVALNDTVNFECTVTTDNYSSSDYHIHWTIVYHHQPLQDWDYQVSFHSSNGSSDDNTTSSSSTLSYTATREMNGSVVSCSVQEAVGGPLVGGVNCTVWVVQGESRVSPT